MSNSQRFRVQLSWISALLLCLLSPLTSAQIATYTIYSDAGGSGCPVNIPALGLNLTGIDSALVATVDTNTLQVTGVTIADCNGATFNAPVNTNGPFPVGLNNGVAGSDVVELSAPLTSIGPQSRRIQVYVVSENQASGVFDQLITIDGLPNSSGIFLGVPIAVPLANPWVLGLIALMLLGIGVVVIRRQRILAGASLMFFVGLAFAAHIIVDGDALDWAPANQRAADATGDATGSDNSVDIVAFFAAIEGNSLFARIDLVDLENNPPVANPGSDTTMEDTLITLTVTGTDLDGDPITFAQSTAPSNGSLSAFTIVNATTSTVDYTPFANYVGADQFLFVADDGQALSAPVAFDLTVTAVNDAPQFNVGTDQTVLEDSGAQTISNWASAILPGPATAVDEVGQLLSFNITNNDNAALFAVQPAVAADGTLSFTAAADANGSANVTLELMDDGGTANGGMDTSATQTFIINVTAVNDVPSFTAGADQMINEDAGAQSIATWATGLSAGPADEAGQLLSFNITANDNAPLFSVAPAVAADGTLTYTTAPDANGIANISLNIMDDGGTANGGVDTSAGQSFIITVTAVNDAPTFTAGADQTVLEDSGAQIVNAWATGIAPGPATASDEVGQTVSFNITNNDNAALFSALPSVAADGTLSYTPAADANGSANITLELMDDGGTANGGVDTSATQIFIINITPVNDVPAFTAGPNQMLNEDAGPQSIAAWAMGLSSGPADEAAQLLSFNITGNDNPSLFSAGPAVAANGTLTFTTAADANGTANIILNVMDDGGTANGGVDTSATQSFSIVVAAVNDPPAFVGGANQTVLEDSIAQTVAAWATNVLPGPLTAADENGQALTFNITGNTDMSLFAVQPSVDSIGTLTYTPAADASGTATITLTLMDNGGGTDTSAAQMFDINITQVNDAPSFAAGPNTMVAEDAGPQSIAAWATGLSPGPFNEAAQLLSFNITGNDNPSLFSAGPAVAANGTLTFTTAVDANGTANIILNVMDNGGTANGGVDTSATQTFSIVVAAVNDPPVFVAGANQMVLEDASPQTVAGWVAFFLPGPLTAVDENGQALTFNITGNTDMSLFAVQPSVDAIGTLTYSPAADASGTATISLTLMDNGGGTDTSAAQMFDITIAQVNDAPSFMVGPDPMVAEDAGPQSIAAWATAISPGPLSESGQLVSFVFTANDNPGLFMAGPAVAADGTLSFTSTLNAGGVANLSLRIMDDGGVANGGVDTSVSQSFSITITPMNDPPVLVAPGPFAVTPNIRINIPGGASDLLAGASDPDGLTNITVNDLDGIFATVNGGTVTADIMFGTFSYDPPPGFVGADTFQYNVCDDGIPLPSQCSTMQTVTFNVGGNVVWFIDNSLGAGDGRLVTPFNSINSFNVSPSTPGDFVFLATGSGTYNESGILLDDNQVLFGEGTTAVFDTLAGITPSPESLARPVLGGTRPAILSNSNAINLALNNTIRGLDIGNTTAFGLSGNAVGNLAVDEVSVTGTGGAVRVGTSGAFGTNVTFDSLESNTATSSAIDLTGVTGSMLVSTSTAGIVNSAASPAVRILTGSVSLSFPGPITNTVDRSVEILGTTGGTSTFSGTINDTAMGISLTGNTGANINFSGLTLATTTNVAFSATGGGTVNVTGANNTIVTTTATALNVNATTIGAAGMTFQSISSGAGASTGIMLDTTGALGGLSVSGDGSTPGSGGTIANKVGADGSITNGIGIYLNATQDVSLSFMQLNDHSNFAIRGINVTRFSMANSVVNGINGTNIVIPFDEDAIRFNNLLDSASFTDSTIEGGVLDNIRVINDTGTLNRMTISGGTIGLNAFATGNDGILFEARNNAIANLSVLGVNFTGARGDMIQCNALATSTMDCVIQENTFANTHGNIVSGGGGITISGGSGGGNITVTYDVSAALVAGQIFTGANGNAVTANFVNGAGFVDATIVRNRVGVLATPASGSIAGNGIAVGATSNVAHTVSIDSNLVYGVSGFGGIDVVANIDVPFRATITNNTVTGMDGFAFSALTTMVGGVGTEIGTACLDIRGNVFDASGAAFGGSGAFLDQISAAANYDLPGYAGSTNGEFAFACAAGTASGNVAPYLAVTNGNILTDGAFPLFPGAEASTVCGMVGPSANCL